MYPDVSLYIDGNWCKGSDGKSQPVLNPATGVSIGTVPHASRADLDRALLAVYSQRVPRGRRRHRRRGHRRHRRHVGHRADFDDLGQDEVGIDPRDPGEYRRPSLALVYRRRRTEACSFLLGKRNVKYFRAFRFT